MADFYADHAVARNVAVLLRAAGPGAVTVRELRSERATDDGVAVRHGEIVITHKESD